MSQSALFLHLFSLHVASTSKRPGLNIDCIIKKKSFFFFFKWSTWIKWIHIFKSYNKKLFPPHQTAASKSLFSIRFIVISVWPSLNFQGCVSFQGSHKGLVPEPRRVIGTGTGRLDNCLNRPIEDASARFDRYPITASCISPSSTLQVQTSHPIHVWS